MLPDTIQTYKPQTVEDIQTLLRGGARLLPRGGGTKTALSMPAEGWAALDMRQFRGITAYEAHELTFSALAGTPVAEVQAALAENGQYLPCDPPLASRGATLGGMTASGVSGPGRYLFGGITDFLLGVRFVDGGGHILRGGGVVVKNAAGFDLPKLLTGSCGAFGALVELSFKVFPLPQAFVSLRLDYEDLDSALIGMKTASGVGLALAALDLRPIVGGYSVWARLGGLAAALPARLERLARVFEHGQTLGGAEEANRWRAVSDLDWLPDGWSWVKVALTPGQIPALEAVLAPLAVQRRYIAGGQAAWLAIEGDPRQVDEDLAVLGLSGQVLIGPPGPLWLGKKPGGEFLKRVKSSLDPEGLFVEI